jgi:hypothetical protein
MRQIQDLAPTARDDAVRARAEAAGTALATRPCFGAVWPDVPVAAKALLDENPDPSETELRSWRAGDPCRGKGPDKIVRAVLHTAADMRKAAI